MKANDRIQSTFNIGTVKSVAQDGTLSVHWDRFIGAVEVPANVAVTFKVVEIAHEGPQFLGGDNGGD